MAYSPLHLKTYRDLYLAVLEEIKGGTTDTNQIARVKRNLNIVYNEVVEFSRWTWLNGHITVPIPAAISAGTVAVTQNSSIITFTSAPSGSKAGYYFSPESSSEIYLIESHTSGSTTALLSDVYVGATAAAAGYRLWTDKIPLPTNCDETINVYSDARSTPLDNVGLQEFRRITASSPKSEGKPWAYYTGELIDPIQTSSITSLPALSTLSSSGVVKTVIFVSGVPSSIDAGVRIKVSGASDPGYNGDFLVSAVSTTSVANDTITYVGRSAHQESLASAGSTSIVSLDQVSDIDRYRELYVFPSINTSRTILHVDYIKKVTPLVNDSDEPIIPLNDRTVLLYGALALSWAREGNDAQAARNTSWYTEKLARMSGKIQDTFDKPRIAINKNYLATKRFSNGGRSPSASLSSFGSVGGSGAVTSTGTPNMAAQFGSDGVLVASSTVSTTELGYLDGVSSNVQTQLDAITTLANGKIYLGNSGNVATEITPTGDVTISNTGVTAISAGVIVDADINSSAAITRSKIASGTAYRILTNNASGVMSENAALTASQAVFTDANSQLVTSSAAPGVLNSFTLADNQSSAANVTTWTISVYDSIGIEYSIKRGTAYERGIINLTTDGTSAGFAQGAIASVGSNGITLTADISGGTIRLRYTSTSTGSSGTFKWTESKWLS